MKLHFDSNQEYQIEAISAVTDLFEGQPLSGGDFEFSLNETGVLLTENGVGNNVTVTDEQIWENVKRIQHRNKIKNGNKELQGMHFSIEMETGTGKTYVYLRTIFELNKLYGFKKFVIVVPSVAIREGVTSSIKLMKEHFKGLYNNVAFDDFVYQSKDLSRVRQFAVNNEVQIMVINIQAFQKDAGESADYAALTDEQRKKLNVIHQEQ